MTATALLIAASLATAANATVDLDRLEQRVVAFVGAGVGQAGGPLTPIDRRLRLAACDAPPTLDWREPRRDAVVVNCATGARWRIFVPLRVASAARAAAPVQRAAPAVATPPVIKRGDAVSVIASMNGFSVAQQGIAAGDAAPGGRLPVRIDGTAKPVQTVAVEPGLATLPGW